MTQPTRASLRKALRTARRALTPRQQTLAANRLYHRISSQRDYLRARRIAFYLAGDGEIDPGLLLADALARGKHCYLPCLHPFRPDRLLFLRYREGEPLFPHRWGMLEPSPRRAKAISARTLDLVFIPLVGFDPRGNRLGMGKGFYDRSFAFRQRSGRRSPRLIGLAHECQRVEHLENQAWDVQMDKIESDRRTYRARPI
ncbi:MAG: 5-formyltetrahydrofolate cyclo-ligase [Pseudomonadales bacterium]|nr:5-formyltetrahydrofolate cyclo-ligase [Pseudomonadales bacterium]